MKPFVFKMASRSCSCWGHGVGKTTSIGKLTHRYKQEGKKVMLVAADTFLSSGSTGRMGPPSRMFQL